MVWMCKKALPGSRQAGRAFREHSDGLLVQNGWKRTMHDPCAYIKWEEGQSTPNTLCVHVDDVITCCTDGENDRFHALAKSAYEKGDKKVKRSDAKEFLGIQYQRTQDNGYFLSQSQYVERLALKAGVVRADGGYPKTPLSYDLPDVNDCWQPEQGPNPHEAEYRSLQGGAVWAARSTRPDLLHGVCYLAQYQARPGPKHLKALKGLIAYAYGTKDIGLTYSLGFGDKVVVHADASWNEADSVANGNCMGGFCVHQYGLIGVHCGRQPTVALSTQEAELNEVVNAGKYLVWLRGFMDELGTPLGEVSVFEDNNPVVLAANNYGSKHQRLKHVLRKVYKVHEWITDGIFKLIKIRTNHNVADIFTKRLDVKLFEVFRGALLASPKDAGWELPEEPAKIGAFTGVLDTAGVALICALLSVTRTVV